MCKNKRLKYSRNTLNKIDATINNSRLFWRELKRLTGKPRITQANPLDAWYEHFSSVFNSGHDVDDNQTVPDNATDDNLDGIQELVFNSPITDDDIIENDNKSFGGTLIPEHLIYGIHVLLPFIRKHFKMLFTRGEFPEQWTKIIIIP